MVTMKGAFSFLLIAAKCVMGGFVKNKTWVSLLKTYQIDRVKRKITRLYLSKYLALIKRLIVKESALNGGTVLRKSYVNNKLGS